MPFLVQLGKGKVETTYDLDNLPVTIGRQENNHIVLRDTRVSRQHGRIEAENGSVALIDLDSTHKTYVNQQPVGKKLLAHGDLISVGQKIDFLFLERQDDGLVETHLKRLRAMDLPENSESTYSGYVNRQISSLVDNLRSNKADTGALRKVNDDISRAVAELKCLYEIGNAINSELDLDRVLELIIHHVIKASQAERGIVMLKQMVAGKERLVPVVARNIETALDDQQRTQVSFSIANKAVELKQTVVALDTNADPAMTTQSVVDYNIRSAICAPLHARGSVIGVLYVDAKQSMKEFNQKDVDFFTALANQSSIAIENAQLMRSLQASIKKLDRKVAELSALYSISQALINCSDLDTVLATILDKSIETVGVERGSIMLYADEQDILTVRVVRGVVNPESKDRIRLRRGEGIAGRVLETGQGVIANQGFHDPQFKRVSEKEADVRQILCVPLQGNKTAIGVINLINRTGTESRPFTQDDLQLMSSIGSQAAVTIENSRLYNMAVFDSLTQVHVRRFFDGWLLKEYERARRYGTDLSLILLDIDHFKSFNDTYGHQVGDLVLQALAKVLRGSIRETDLVARWGGEEFVIGLPETATAGAELFAERLRMAIELVRVEAPGHILKFTASLGVCNIKTSEPKTRHELLGFADKALYLAKGGGRNKCVLHLREMEAEEASS